jgi:membrane protein DedA with SNARE-associated domain
MNLGRFIFFTGLGAGVWCAILTYLGWIIGRHGEEVQAVIGTYVHHTLRTYILPGIVILLCAYVLWRRRGRSRVTE